MKGRRGALKKETGKETFVQRCTGQETYLSKKNDGERGGGLGKASEERWGPLSI